MKLHGYIFYEDMEEPVEIPDDMDEETTRTIYALLMSREARKQRSISGYLIIKEDD